MTDLPVATEKLSEIGLMILPNRFTIFCCCCWWWCFKRSLNLVSKISGPLLIRIMKKIGC